MQYNVIAPVSQPLSTIMIAFCRHSYVNSNKYIRSRPFNFLGGGNTWLFWKNKWFWFSVKKVKLFWSSVKKIKCFWWPVKNKLLFTIRPIFRYTKYEKKWDDQAKHPQNDSIYHEAEKIIWFCREAEKGIKINCKSHAPQNIKWSAPYYILKHDLYINLFLFY